jgi:hypothetical protein
MLWRNNRILFILIIAILLLATFLMLMVGCGSTQDLLPGRYGTTHEGQTWVIDLQDDSSWTGTFGGELLTTGRYELDWNQITWLTDSHCESSGHPGEGTYRWRYRNDRLTFKAIGEDPCMSRKVILEDEVYRLE